MKIQTFAFRGVGLLAVVLLILSGCTTQKKATKWFDDNRKAAAKYCAVKFPVLEKTDTAFVIDSAGYEAAYWELWKYADSLLTTVSKDTQYIERNNVNIDSLRKVIALQIREKVKPCIDSVKVVTKTVLDTKQLDVANGVIDDLEKELKGKDATISKRDDRITVLEGKISAKNKALWIAWVIVIFLLVWMNRKLLVRLITKLPI